jgi:HAD superfamily hydrolase (TIGR01549 family)
MIQSLLLDLDDTLLGNEVDAFMKGYFGLLSDYAGKMFDASTFMPKLMTATQAMIKDTDPTFTNDQVFWRSFEVLIDGKRDELEPFFQAFYEQEFGRLRLTTQQRPAAATIIRAAREQGLSIVVATNPLFPRIAIEQRLEWAGIPVGDHDFALVTCYENMHAAKPQQAYYREILAAIGVEPDQALMVGDDWQNDILPAAAVGLHTFWIAPNDAVADDPTLISGRGSLDDLAERVTNGWLQELDTPA